MTKDMSLTTSAPSLESLLVGFTMLAAASGPYMFDRCCTRGTALVSVGLRKNGFHITSKDTSFENAPMADSRRRFTMKHL